jgi:lantibiotic leader peptide-processing serine protease
MRRVVPLLGFAALVACSDTLPVEHVGPSAPRFSVADNAVNRYVIQLSNGVDAEEFTRAVTSLGGSVVAVHQRAGFAVVDGLTGAGAASLGRQRGVQAVEPDLVAQVVDPAAQLIGAMPIEGADVGAESQANPATAILFGLQWNQRAIGSPKAWAAGRLGSSSVKVAILDSGIDDTWPDFTARGGANSATALVDKTRSASFLPTVGASCLDPSDHELINGRAATSTCPALPAFFPGKPVWADLNGHGTFTAGIVSSNGFAFAGVTSKVTLMAVKVLNARGNGAFSSILQGVVYATDNGADVINMSLGSVFLQHGGYIGFLNGITRYARSRGVTIVVAAGNDAIDLDHSGGLYEAFCSSGMVICVSATGPVLALNAAGKQSDFGPNFLPTMDEPAIYSNYGTSSVDVAAPGGNYAVDKDGKLVSRVLVWGGCSRTALDYIPGVPASEGTPAKDPSYKKSICTTGLFTSGAVGTSAASPHVAGLAALLVERLGRDPGLIRETLQATADDLGKPGADPHYGKGRINVARALGL